jgi:hypothetical protein
MSGGSGESGMSGGSGGSGMPGGSGMSGDMGGSGPNGGPNGGGSHFGSSYSFPTDIITGGGSNIFSDDNRDYEKIETDTGIVFQGTTQDASTGREDSLNFEIKKPNFGSGSGSANGDDWLTFSMVYKRDDSATSASKAGSSSSTNDDVETSIDVGFCGIIEFFESGDSAGFDSKDEVVHKEDTQGFGDFSDVSTSDDYSKLESTTGDGQFTVTIYISDAGATLDNGMDIKSSEMKFDLKIANHTYTQDGTRLALCMSVSTSNTKGVEKYLKDDVLEGFTCDSSNGEAQSYFTWISAVETNTETGSADIVVSVDTDNGNVYFTIDTDEQPTEIVWDPIVGVSGQSISGSAASDGASAIGASVAVLASIVLLLMS